MNKTRVINRIKITSLFIVFILTMLPAVLHSQNSTNSPYTRYGYGKLADQAFGSQRGMGGIGFGLRNSQMINPLNPASYSSVDSMTFMLDFGVMGQMAWYEDNLNNARSKKTNGSLEYLAMQFPLAKNIGMGLGIEPVSYVGYSYGDTVRLNEVDGLAQYSYKGSGGLSKVYTNLSYNLFQRLSVGVNVGYLFGDIINSGMFSNSVSGSFNVLRTDTLRASGLVYEAGLQYYYPLAKNKNIVFGAVFSPKIKINSNVYKGIISYNSNNNAIENSDNYVSRDSIFELPETYGVGVTFNDKNKFTVGADLKYQRWASARFYNRTDTLSNQLKVSLGGEYIPNHQSSNFLKRTRYRVGAYYTDSYINVNGSGHDEYGASLGLGIPMNDRRSFLNFAFEYTMIKPELKTMIDEQYFKITVSYTFNELWFFKRKVQ